LCNVRRAPIQQVLLDEGERAAQNHAEIRDARAEVAAALQLFS